MGEKLFGDKPVEEVGILLLLTDCTKAHRSQLTIQDFRSMAQTVMAQEPDVTHWTFGEYVVSFDILIRHIQTCPKAAARPRYWEVRRREASRYPKGCVSASVILSCRASNRSCAGPSSLQAPSVRAARHTSCACTRSWVSSRTANGVSARSTISARRVDVPMSFERYELTRSPLTVPRPEE